jgi:hypothetical protein
MSLNKRGENISARMFKRFLDPSCFVHRSPAPDWWTIDQKSLPYVQDFAVPVNDNLDLSFKYL